MKKRLAVATLVVAVILAMFVGWKSGSAVPFAEQWPLYEGLRNTAAIIFGVIGAWMAIVFPDRLRLTFRRDATTEVATVGKKFGQLFAPVVHSTAILSIVMVIGVVAPLVKRMSWDAVSIAEWRGASFAVLVGLTAWQLWSVVLTLLPADELKSVESDERNTAAAVRHRRGVGEVLRSIPNQKKEC